MRATQSASAKCFTRKEPGKTIGSNGVAGRFRPSVAVAKQRNPFRRAYWLKGTVSSPLLWERRRTSDDAKEPGNVVLIVVDSFPALRCLSEVSRRGSLGSRACTREIGKTSWGRRATKQRNATVKQVARTKETKDRP